MKQRKRILSIVLAFLIAFGGVAAYGGEGAVWDSGVLADGTRLGADAFLYTDDEPVLVGDGFPSADDEAVLVGDGFLSADDEPVFADDDTVFDDDGTVFDDGGIFFDDDETFVDDEETVFFEDDADDWAEYGESVDAADWDDDEIADESDWDDQTGEEFADDELPEQTSLPATAEGADSLAPGTEDDAEDKTPAVVSVELPERVELDGFYAFSLEADPDADGMLALTGDEMMLTTEAEKDEIEEAAYAEAELLQAILEEREADTTSADIGQTDIEPADIEPADIEPADIEPTDLESADVEPAAADPAAAAPPEPLDEPIEIEPTEIGSDDGSSAFDLDTLSDEDAYIVKNDLLLDALVGDSASSLPASFRTGSLTPVVSQGTLNACWTYSALDAGQIELLAKGIGDGSYLFSPGHLQYAAFHGVDESWGTQSKTWQKIGGTPALAGSTLLRWYGAAPSASYATPGSFVSDSFSMTAEELAISMSHLTSYQRLASPNGSGYATQPLESRLAAIEAIKRTVYDGCPVTIDFSTAGRDAATASYYNAASGINHEAVIVGWNDDKITAATGTDGEGNTVSLPGAFLIKNSYGPYRGENGYEWLSYYDCSMDRPCVFHFENTVTGNHVHEDLFSYDGTGYRYWLTSSAQKLAYANVFTADTYEHISAVGFYLPAGASYTVTLRTGLTDGKPASGRVAAQVSGTESYLGFYTVDLGREVTVKKGESFAVIVESAVDGVSYCYFEGQSYNYTNGLSQTTVCNSGQSFLSIGGGAYVDILESRFAAQTPKTNGSYNKTNEDITAGATYGNACIKAYGNPAAEFTTLNGVDYSAVYDFNYYIAADAGRAKLYAGDPAGALRHFVENGMRSLERGNASFDVRSYINEYASLRRKYGTDWPAYYRDYMDSGAKNGLRGTGCTTMKNPVTTYGGVDYAPVYNYAYYLKKYASLKTKYQYDDYGALKYFVTKGMARKQQASASFNVISYLYEYAVVRRACGTDWKAYYLNYIKTGVKKGRHGTGCKAMKNPVTKYKGVDYKYVYNYAYYMNRYGTLKKKYRYDDYGALEYFVKNGTGNMHRASKDFDVRSYVNEYEYLRRKFGTKWLPYYQDFAKYGKKNGRHGTGCTRMKKPLAVYKGKSYAREYSFYYYISHYAAIKKKYQYDDYGALKYYVTVDRKKKRKAI